MDFDTQVKLNIYHTIAETTRVPDAYQVAATLDVTPTAVQEAFQRLARTRLLVLEPGTTDRIRMAPPFSGVATPFRVQVDDRSYYANCIWDALGVAAALGQDAIVRTNCGHSEAPLVITVTNNTPETVDYPVHFAEPAARWWDDIIYT